MNKLILSLAALAAPLAGFAAITIDPNIQFDATTDYDNNFTEYGTASQYTWSSTAGIGGGGGIAITTPTGGTTSANWFTYNTGFTFTTEVKQNLSIMFLYDAGITAAFGADTRVAALGFSSSGSTPGEATGTAFRLFQQNGLGETLNPTIRNNGSTITPAGASAVTLADNTWYQLSVSLTKTTTADTFDYTFNLDAMNPSGTAIASNVFSYAGSLVNAGSYINTRYLSFYGGNDNNGTGAIALDNFGTAVVPEPSTYALLAGFATLGLVLYRRRLRAE